MALFSAIAAAISSAVAWLGASVLGTAIVQAVVGLAFNALARALAGKPKGPERRERIVGQIQQGADIPRSFILGRYATAGSLVYHNTWGPSGARNEMYTRVTALSDLPIGGVAQIVIDGRTCTLDLAHEDPERGYPVVEYSEINVYEGTPDEIFYEAGNLLWIDGFNPGANDEWLTIERDPDTNVVTRVEERRIDAWVKIYDGTQTTADPFLVGTVSTEERPWTENEVGHGVAYAIATFRIKEGLWQGLPQVLYVIDGVPVRDPRDDTVASTSNPAILAHALLSGFEKDGTWIYGPQGDAAGRLVDAEWGAQADLCDAPVPGAEAMTAQERIEAFGADVIPARYRAGLEVALDQPVADVLEDILSAANARISDAGDRFRFQVGDPEPAAFLITDADIVATAPQRFAPFFSLAETVNAVTATYPSPEDQWENQEAPPLYVAEYEAEDGNRRLVTNVTLDAVPYKEQVQRLMKSALQEARRARSHSMTLPAKFWGVEPGDYFNWTSERNGYEAKRFRIDGVVDLQNGDVQIDATEVDPADYDWQAATDFVPVTPVSIDRPPFAPGFIADWQAVGTVIRDGSGGERRPAIQIWWANIPSARRVLWQIRLDGGTDLVAGGSTDDVEFGTVVVAEGILPGETYQVRARARFADGLGAWSGWLTVTTPGVKLGEADLADAVWGRVEADATAIATTLIDSFDAITLQPHIAEVFGEGGLEAKVDDLRDDVIGPAGLSATVAQIQADVFGPSGFESRTLEDIDSVRRDIALRVDAELDLDQAIEEVTDGLLWLQTRLAGAEGRMADAGITVDPDTGKVELYALARLEEAASALSVELDAQKAEISLRATYAELDQAITDAILDPTQIPVLDGVQTRLSDVELVLDAQAGVLAAKADTTVVDGLDVRVTAAEIELDSVAAQLSLKVDSTSFDALETVVNEAETVLEALDGASITTTARSVRRLDGAIDDDDIDTLAELMAAYRNRQAGAADLAFATADLRARVDQDRTASASAREQIAATVAEAKALIDAESKVRVTETTALARRATTLEVSVGGAEAAITEIDRVAADSASANARALHQLQIDLASPDGGSLLAIQALDGRIGATEAGIEIAGRERSQITARAAIEDETQDLDDLQMLLRDEDTRRQFRAGIADAREELSARVVEGVEAVASARTELSASIADTAATVAAERIVRAAADEAIAQDVVRLFAAVGVNEASIDELSRLEVTSDSALVQSILTLQATVGDGETGLPAVQAEIEAIKSLELSPDTALVQSLDALDAVVFHPAGRLAVAEGALQELNTVDASSQSVLVQAHLGLAGSVADIETGLTSAEAAIDQLNTVSLGSGSALAQSVATLSAQVNDPATGLEAAHGDIESIRALEIGSDTALARSLDSLSAQVGGDGVNAVPDNGITLASLWTLGSGWALVEQPAETGWISTGTFRYADPSGSGLSAALQSASFRVVPGAAYRVGFQARRQSAGTIRVRGWIWYLNKTGAAISAEQIAFETVATSGTKSFEKEVVIPAEARAAYLEWKVDRDTTTVGLDVGGPVAERIAEAVQEVRGAIDELNTVDASSQSVLVQSHLSLTASIEDPQTGLDATRGEVQDLLSLNIAPGTALAQRFSQLDTQVGSAQASLTTQAQSIDGIRAVWGVKANNNGDISGFGLISTLVDGGAVSEFSVVADKFAIAAPGGGKTSPFIHYTGDQLIDGVVVPAGTYLKDAFIRNGMVSNFLQSADYQQGVAGWQLRKDGSAEFNGVVISRDQIIESGEKAFGNVDGDLAPGAGSFTATELQHVETVWIETGVSAVGWAAEPHSYTATVGFSSPPTVVETLSGQPDYGIVQWSVVGTPTAVTRWAGDQRIWIRCEIWSRNVQRFTPLRLNYQLRKVT